MVDPVQNLFNIIKYRFIDFLKPYLSYKRSVSYTACGRETGDDKNKIK
jgi:hypothetical protein